MGCSLPWAIGASIATGRRKVFCITGDGGLQMNIQELQAVAREQLPIKIFVLNNRVLGKISEIQEISYGKHFAQTTGTSGYTVPDFERLSESYGIKARTLDNYEDLDSCQGWISDNEPCLVNILLPEDSKLIPKMNWNQKEMMPLLKDEVITKVRGLLN